MSDLLRTLSENPITAPIVRALGLPNPVELARVDGGYEDFPFKGKSAYLISTNGYAGGALENALRDAGALVFRKITAADSKVDVVVMDATGCLTPIDYRAIYDGFHSVIRRIAPNGRVLIVAATPEGIDNPINAAVARGVEGFSRSLGKELGKYGVSVNLANAAPDAVEGLHGVVRFFCGPQTAYVSGQVVTVTAAVKAPENVPTCRVLEGKVAVVTGCARGIGLATAQRLSQEGALVVCVDVPAATEEINKVAASINGVALPLDISSPEAPRSLAHFLRDKFGGVDIVIHNAGITRDKTLANMNGQLWDLVVSVNFAAVTAIDERLINSSVLRDNGRIVCLSSISGIAGNYGQTNYGLTKAALIGYVAAQSKKVAHRGICINAVAPGFIETPMTDAMPFATREIGKRLNSVKQGGRPRDVAELITFLSTPAAFGVTGNTIRVCGQGLIGA